MRLTLRTLLAYLDEILDPQDAQQLQSKIEDSEFATSLVHQIRGSVRRLRLDAPALDAQGIGGDLNSVAEYLDNVLPPDQVPALEKACLDNEVNLGEVASCHQVLTLVLGEPADINDRMRQQSYAVAPTVEPSELPPSSIARIDVDPAHRIVPPPASSATLAATTPTQPDISAVPAPPDPTSATQPKAAVETTAKQVTSEPEREKKRPSERFNAPIDVRSTREAWRAEAKQALDESHESAASAAVVGGATAAASGSRAGYPEYMDRKSSWLRSAFITGLVALLILAGLLFATGPIDNGFLARWLGQRPTTVAHQPSTTPVEPIPVEPLNSNEPIAVEVVDANQPTGWNEPADNGFQSEPGLEPPPVLDVAAPAELPSETDQADMNVREDSLPNLTPENRFDGNPLDADLLANNPKNETEVADTPRSDLPTLPEIEPDADLATTGESSRESSTESANLEVDPRLGNAVVPDDVIVVTPNLPPKGEFPDVPPAPVSPEGNIARTEAPLVPPVGSVVAPLVDPGVDLAPAPINPPVASPASDSGLSDANSALQMPTDEPDTPEPERVASLEPTKLKQADHVLLVFDSEADDWTRVDSNVPLEASDFLMGMPAFRADIEIGSSIVCTMVGASRLQLGPAADLTLHDGQLLLRNKEADNVQGVRWQGERLQLEMNDVDGLVAIQASRSHVPGSDVMEVPHSMLKIYAIRNNATVQYMGQDYDVQEGYYLLAFDNYPPRIEEASEKPNWTSSSAGFDGDKKAVRVWKKGLHQSQNMRIWLQERANRRYSERALAARCLAEMDEFDAIVSALNDPEQHAFWEQHFDTLRRAMTRGSETVGKLQLELEKAHGERAAFMLEMIRGHSQQQLASGAAAKLVKYLDHRSLAHRVLAIQNLNSITGYSLAFQPEKPNAYRRRAVRQWKGKLSAGKVTYRNLPEVKTLLESFVGANKAANQR